MADAEVACLAVACAAKVTEPAPMPRPARGGACGWCQAFGLLNLAMTSQTHDSARAERARRSEYSHFEHKLRDRWCQLRDETGEALARSENEAHAEIAGRVGDLEDQSLADLLVDVNLAEVARDVQEIRAIEHALRRIALGTYGICVSCGEPIEHERLEAYPIANRCAACQRAYEHGHASTPTPRL
jgi:RNA polymerase-binding transcription factor